MKIVTVYPFDEKLCRKIQGGTADAFVTPNGEQVLALVRAGEAKCVGIILGACAYNEIDLMKAIHKINPSIPVMVLTDTVPEGLDANEHVTSNVGFFFGAICEFLNGEMTKEDYEILARV